MRTPVDMGMTTTDACSDVDLTPLYDGVLAVVSTIYGFSVAQLRGPRGSASMTTPRMVAAAALLQLGLNTTQVGAALCRERTTHQYSGVTVKRSPALRAVRDRVIGMLSPALRQAARAYRAGDHAQATALLADPMNDRLALAYALAHVPDARAVQIQQVLRALRGGHADQRQVLLGIGSLQRMDDLRRVVLWALPHEDALQLTGMLQAVRA